MSATIKIRRLIFLFWGSMDAFYIGLLTYSALRRGVTPFISDIHAALISEANWNGWASPVIWVGFVLQMSVFVTCVLFFLGHRAAIRLAWLQLPFRLLLRIPSVATIFLWPKIFPEIYLWLWISMQVLSEAFKGWSLWWLQRNAGATEAE